MKITLKELLDTEIPYQAALVSKAEAKVYANPIRQGSTYEETQKLNQYDTETCIKNYYTHLKRLEALREVQVSNSLTQMILLKRKENLKSKIAFLRRIAFPPKIYQKAVGYGENAVITEYKQAYHEFIDPLVIDTQIEQAEGQISVIQQQIHSLNNEKFVVVPDRI